MSLSKSSSPVNHRRGHLFRRRRSEESDDIPPPLLRSPCRKKGLEFAMLHPQGLGHHFAGVMPAKVGIQKNDGFERQPAVTHEGEYRRKRPVSTDRADAVISRRWMQTEAMNAVFEERPVRPLPKPPPVNFGEALH